jgi:ribonuclease HII
MLLLGIDEAGKGPVIGSMFVAGMVIDEEKLFDLSAIGVKDSKQLTPERREILAKKIIRIATDQYILEVQPRVIDELRQVMTMNDIMVRCFAQILKRLSYAHRAILDAADVNEERFAKRVLDASGTTMEILAEHRADQNHQVVSAASILAKVKRDLSIRELEQSMSCIIGSGYPNDPQTIMFLSQWVKEHRELPTCARHTWATAQRIKASFI